VLNLENFLGEFAVCVFCNGFQGFVLDVAASWSVLGTHGSEKALTVQSKMTHLDCKFDQRLWIVKTLLCYNWIGVERAMPGESQKCTVVVGHLDENPQLRTSGNGKWAAIQGAEKLFESGNFLRNISEFILLACIVLFGH
jgi:hypothetical protein